MQNVQSNADSINISGYGHATGLIWRARLPYRQKAALQALLTLVSERRGQMRANHAVVTYPARYVADLLDVAPCTASRTIGELHNLGLVTRTVERFEGCAGAIVTTVIHFDRLASQPRADEGWRRRRGTAAGLSDPSAPAPRKEDNTKSTTIPLSPPAGRRLRQRRRSTLIAALAVGGRTGPEKASPKPDTGGGHLAPELEAYDAQILEMQASAAKTNAGALPPPDRPKADTDASPHTEADANTAKMPACEILDALWMEVHGAPPLAPATSARRGAYRTGIQRRE